VPRKRNRLSQFKFEKEALGAIGRWVQQRKIARNRQNGGPAFYVRDQLANDTDFFSAEPLSTLENAYFISYAESNQLYGFDLRSLHTILHRALTTGEAPLNPYTRSPIPAPVVETVKRRVAAMESRGLAVSWAPLDPPTPEQRSRMRVVDLFMAINELNYYSSPEWFFALDAAAHRQFYTELHSIWTFRAGLTEDQKTAIVPNHATRVFRIAPFAIVDMTLEAVVRLNASTMRILIQSAAEKSDRVLGAMYVVSALTLVNREARAAYPWLYESVYEPPTPPPARFGWIRNLFGIRGIPFLELPPPRGE
jgi:hypothetical protein